MTRFNDAFRSPVNGPSREPANGPPGRWPPVRSEPLANPRGVSRSALLTADDERALGQRIINDNCPASREQLVRANLHLVVAIATGYSGRGLPLSDLIEEGNTGLRLAVEVFDPTDGARFSTCASWWIKHAIRQALLNAMHSNMSMS